MNLAEYLANDERSGADLARALGVPEPLVSQWKKNRRPVPIERCADIERTTGGLVTRKDLRPDDWHRIWPELAAAHPERVPAEPTGPAAEPAKAA
jgi:DNA-binding transcriptional regulator YdaS (Cro superfamily)